MGNNILSDDKIQKVFDKLQPLDADFISFGDLLFGCRVVSFKQKAGDIYKSGSIIIDENGEIIPIMISREKTYDGLDCIKPGKGGSSLLQLGYITDIDGNKTQTQRRPINGSSKRLNWRASSPSNVTEKQ